MLPLKLRSFVFAPLIASTSIAVNAQGVADPGIKEPSKFDRKRPLAQELQASVHNGFRLVAVGDCVISRPLSQYASREPGFAQSIRILEEGDATYGNLETSIIDMRSFAGAPYTGVDDVPLVAEPSVAKDLAAMGFNLMSRSNNHALDWGIEGMRETSRWTDQAGLITAGVGENQALARSAHYYESAKGRVGIISMASTFAPSTEALPEQGAAPGRPGVSGLAVKKTVVVPSRVMRDLQTIAQELYPETFSRSASDDKDQRDKLTVFDTKFEVGPRRSLRYEIDPTDLA